MTENQVVAYIIDQLNQKVEIKYIKAHLLSTGINAKDFDAAYQTAQLTIQQKAANDPTIRLFLGAALLGIGGTIAYTNYLSRSFGISMVLGIPCLLYGIKLYYSLAKQWITKK
jgi:hypothetical protein